MTNRMPEKIGHYNVVSQLGRGGMGVVYKAREESLNRFVAIKVLGEALTEDKTFLHRFVREAQAAAGLSHPNLVQIYYIGEDNGQPFFVMEYVTGKSLDHLVREEGRIDNRRAAQMILQAAHGLAAAHDAGIIHRDIKPANLILNERGLVKIADFGLALPADAEMKLTATGMMVGTPGFLAPEQCRGEKVDQRTDIYALGITYYVLLSGTQPFRGESPLALLRQILDEEPPDLGTLNPNVDEETRRIVKKMIAKKREDRYADCHQIVADLEEYLAKQGVRSMTAGLAVRTPTAAQDLPTTVTPLPQDAATRVETAPKAPAAPAAATVAMATAAVAGPTVVQSPPAARTLPDTPMVAAPTMPGNAPMAAAGTPAPPPARSSAFRILALVLVLAIGAAVAAGFVGLKMYRSWQASQQQAALVTEPATTT
ncbi:MAG TPA: serine/threonine-protein kinase, partial [Thermoanaerobaculia bacterium]|nr:serine/threonine-protein kinase [Thermoanaerobaculia bacterium]